MSSPSVRLSLPHSWAPLTGSLEPGHLEELQAATWSAPAWRGGLLLEAQDIGLDDKPLESFIPIIESLVMSGGRKEWGEIGLRRGYNFVVLLFVFQESSV